MIKIFLIVLLTISLFKPIDTRACSIIYYIDKKTGKIYVANNEDYWYDVKPYIQIIPRSGNKLARLWYGWNNLAQGGINEAGLFFDGATTPEQKTPNGYVTEYKGNLGDELLASCKTVSDAIYFLEEKKIAISQGHLMFGDSSGNASIIEWVNGEKKIIPITDNKLVMTNFLLSDTTAGDFPCERYNSIDENIKLFEVKQDTMTLARLRNVVGKAVQLPKSNDKGRQIGTLYSTFLNITDMQFVLVYKLDDTKLIKLDLTSEFENKKKRKIDLK
jgi:predicted choloylglycine hydrolase